MRKEMSYMHYFIEVAPSPVIHPHKASHAPMLETIVEEAAPEKEKKKKMKKEVAPAPKIKAIYFLPIILSFVTYMLMSRITVA